MIDVCYVNAHDTKRLKYLASLISRPLGLFQSYTCASPRLLSFLSSIAQMETVAVVNQEITMGFLMNRCIHSQQRFRNKRFTSP